MSRPVTMEKVVNLNRVRKAKQRRTDARQAAVNRAANGRTTADKDQERIENERRARQMDGLELERPDD